MLASGAGHGTHGCVTRALKVELVADEIGAAMRYVTVDIHKVERHTSTEDTEPSEAVF